MVGEHGQAATRHEGGEGGVEAGVEVGELGVDLHADRLERPPGGVGAGAPGRRGDRLAHDLGQSGRGLDGPVRHDGPGDGPGEALLPVAGDDSGQLGLLVSVHDVPGGQLLGLVHPHVERGVDPVGEAPARLVQLPAADAEVEQHPDHGQAEGGHLGGGDRPGQVLESAPPEHGPGAVAGEPLPGGGHRLGVPVEAEDDAVPEGLEQGSGVPAASDRSVDQQAGGDRSEGADHLGDHDRLVSEPGGIRHRGWLPVPHGLGPAPQVGRPERIAD